MTARGIYLSQGRSDIGYAVKELSRRMQEPIEGDWDKLKRLGRYLVGRERMVVDFEYQQEGGRIDVWTDSDYAGCRETRKSTSGGVIRMGSHTIKTWSRMQAVVALSSGEAEYYALVKGASEGLGLQGIAVDMGLKLCIHLSTDASAAIGIGSRRGLGKVKNIELNQLWLQDKVCKGNIAVHKLGTEENVADALTKPVGGMDLAKHIGMTGMRIEEERHKIMPTTDGANVDAEEGEDEEEE